MTPLDRVKNQLILGSGWYRREIVQRPSGGSTPFRWMRKRAEMLILNPTAAPQSLSMTVRAGYGNVSPIRHLTILVNGAKLQDLKIEGQARFVTRPFSLSGRAAQIEILVRENAEPLPRPWGLWNRWVPRDARKLNLGVFSATLENGDSGGASGVSEIDFRADPDLGGGAYDGVYADGWVAARASIAMRVPRNCQQVRIRGTAPGGTDLKFPLALRLSADGRQIGEGIVNQPGSFDVRVPFPRPLRSPPRDVVLDVNPSSSCFTNLAGGDTRCLTVRLDKMSLVAADK
jgi:hypothetical protein